MSLLAAEAASLLGSHLSVSALRYKCWQTWLFFFFFWRWMGWIGETGDLFPG